MCTPASRAIELLKEPENPHKRENLACRVGTDLCVWPQCRCQQVTYLGESVYSEGNAKVREA